MKKTCDIVKKHLLSWAMALKNCFKRSTVVHTIRLAVCIYFVLFGTMLQAQDKPYPIYIAPDAPQFMHLMQAENPNILEVAQAYKEYYKQHKFEKNSYTNYYKRWMLWAQQYAQHGGSISIPTLERLTQEEQAIKAARLTKPKNNQVSERQMSGWTFIGPKETYDINGTTKVTWQTNIYCVAIAPSNDNILYAGGEKGGLWKTEDKGLNWVSVSANLLHNSFNAVQIHPTNPDIVYAFSNQKIWKTTDGGNSWATVYTQSGLSVMELLINADNPNIVLAASNFGLLRSTNGGSSWNTLFSQNTWTVKAQPNNANTIWAVRENGNGADVMLSTDAGATWAASNTGFYSPTGDANVTGAILAVCPSTPNKVYVYMCGSGSLLSGYVGVFVSNDSGSTWANTNPANSIGAPYNVPNHANLMTSTGLEGALEQGFYDMAIVVNPNNDQELIAGGTSWFKSTDGGATWIGLGSYIGGVLSWSHPDIQWLAAQGNDLWIASDGGLNYSNNFGASHEARMNGISGCHFWGFDSAWNEDILVGGRYHNGNTAFHQSFPQGKFYRIGGAESATGYVSPSNERKSFFSDVGGKIIKGGFTNGVSSFSTSFFPNESYAYFAIGEMAWHPECWNVVFLGNENILYKSLDGGISYTPLYTFPGSTSNSVYEVEISRANPQVMYCTQWDGTDDKIWRSTDGGLSFNACTPLPLPNNNDRLKITASATDPLVLWVAITYGSNGKKVYKTTNGGQTWINLTTSLLDNIEVHDILAQHGTDGGVYIGTKGGVFYRNNTHNNWQPYSDQLPISIECVRLKPFYRDGKIRYGANGFGVWENQLFEPSATIIQAMADKLSTDCVRDTFYFDDYSVLDHAGASWTWNFPTAVYSANTNTRNAKAIFGQTGQHLAIMTLNTPQGELVDTLTLTINNNYCVADSIPGHTLSLDGINDYAATKTPLNLNSNTVTMTAWIKANGAQNDWSGLMFCRGGNTTSGISIKNDNELRYHWNGGGYSWSSGLYVPNNEWTHVALVVSPSSVKIYKNGVAATRNISSSVEEFDASLNIGLDPNGDPRYFKGLIDEVCIYNTALSQAQIREQMHLTQIPELMPNLVHYYQFNTEQVDNTEYDKARLNHLSLVNGANKIVSTGPFAGGTSYRTTVNAPATIAATNTDAIVQFSGTVPNGEIVLSRLNHKPDQVPDCDSYYSDNHYWILNNYGSNTTFTAPALLHLGNINVVDTNSIAPSTYVLHKRAFNADGNTWVSTLSQANNAVGGTSGYLEFGNNNTIDQAAQIIASNSFTIQKIQGADISCPEEIATYSVMLLDGLNYSWAITNGNGSILSGQGTAQIEVMWVDGVEGEVSVTISKP